MNREQYLSQAANLIYHDILAPIAAAPEGQVWSVSCGFPSRNALSNYRRRVGECWPVEAAGDGRTRHIFISPLLTELVDGYGDGVLPTLVHELIHVVSATPGHRGEFRRIALAVGLEGKMTASVAGNELCQKLNAITSQLGEYPHVSLEAQARGRKQSTRMIKVMATHCTECEYVARTTRVWLTQFGPPKCPHGSPMEVVG